MEIVLGNAMPPVMKFFLSIGQFVSVERNLMRPSSFPFTSAEIKQVNESYP